MTHTLAAPLAAYLVTGGMLFLAVHWVRRVLWKPRRRLPTLGTDGSEEKGHAFDVVQRFFHWSTTVALAVIVLSGLTLYSPAYFNPLTTSLGFPIHNKIQLLVYVHVASVLVLGGLLGLHVAWDFFKLKTWHSIRNRRNDFAELSSRAKGFLAGAAVNWSEKYDVFMKSFHTLLIVLFVGLGFTGIVMYFVAPWRLYPQLLHSSIEPWWMPTPIHDVLGFSLLVLLVAHTYFSLLGTNRPVLRAMATGRISREPNYELPQTRAAQPEDSLEHRD